MKRFTVFASGGRGTGSSGGGAQGEVNKTAGGRRTGRGGNAAAGGRRPKSSAGGRRTGRGGNA